MKNNIIRIMMTVILTAILFVNEVAGATYTYSEKITDDGVPPSGQLMLVHNGNQLAIKASLNPGEFVFRVHLSLKEGVSLNWVSGTHNPTVEYGVFPFPPAKESYSVKITFPNSNTGERFEGNSEVVFTVSDPNPFNPNNKYLSIAHLGGTGWENEESAWLGVKPLKPTLARLGDFRAEKRGEITVVKWQTLAEVGTIGFRVLVEMETGWETSELVPAKGAGWYEINIPAPASKFRLVEMDVYTGMNVLGEISVSPKISIRKDGDSIRLHTTSEVVVETAESVTGPWRVWRNVKSDETLVLKKEASNNFFRVVP